jgi:dimethylamine monooxygenase subunit A
VTVPARTAPRYFPIGSAPVRMAAGLSRHGSDFGNGALDAQFFQVDDAYAHYLAHKRARPERHVIAAHDAAAGDAIEAALAFAHARLAEEHPAIHHALGAVEARDPLEALALSVQEDLAVVAADATTDRVVAADIRFPSGFRPEHVAGASFLAIHGPVPGFVTDARAARSMVRAMCERGPYVRFVWAVCADDVLDHHPDVWPGNHWPEATRAFLRVERQSTVPLLAGKAALFLIRTYLRDVRTLSAEELATLRTALAQAPADIAAYKRLPTLEELDAVLAR